MDIIYILFSVDVYRGDFCTPASCGSLLESNIICRGCSYRGPGSPGLMSPSRTRFPRAEEWNIQHRAYRWITGCLIETMVPRSPFRGRLIQMEELGASVIPYLCNFLVYLCILIPVLLSFARRTIWRNCNLCLVSESLGKAVCLSLESFLETSCFICS